MPSFMAPGVIQLSAQHVAGPDDLYGRCLSEVEKVIDEISGNLHAAGEEGAQQGGQGLELPIAESQGTTQQYGDDGSRQGLGTGGEKPGTG